ncbi:MAG: hypothetical protein JST84_28325 [Acidobacteria bacterium]|nr:hypothetical protein [Acidobacteriota bacterium]
MRIREQESQGLRAELSIASTKIASLQTELSTLATTIKTRDGWITEMEQQQKEIQADLDARISELDELKAETDCEIDKLKMQLETANSAQLAELETLKVRIAEAEGAAKLEKKAQGDLASLRASFDAQAENLAGANLQLQQLPSLKEKLQERESAVAELERKQQAMIKEHETQIAQLKVRITELEFLAREVKEPTVKVSSSPTTSAENKDRDDLKKVFGIGPVLEKLLNQHGIYWFHQIAKWEPEDVQRYDNLLENFRGRIEREGWIASAREEYQKKYGESL